MTPEQVIFYLVGGLALFTALGMVTSRNLVHAALFMVSNFGLTAILYLALHAPFLASVQVIVYAGAIMVLFLFVVMLLGKREAVLDEPLALQRPLGALGLVVFGGALFWAIARSPLPTVVREDALPEDFGSPAQIGRTLFTDWVLPFELVSLLLLVAMIGVVVIARFGVDRDPEEAG